MVCESHDDAIEFACAMKGVNPEHAANIIDSDNIVPLLFIESDPQTHFTGNIEPGGVSVLPCSNKTENDVLHRKKKSISMSDDELTELEAL